MDSGDKTMKYLLLLLCVVLTGCTTIEYGKLKYTNFMFDKEVKSLILTIDPNDNITSVQLLGHKSEADYFVDLIKTGVFAGAGYQVGAQK